MDVYRDGVLIVTTDNDGFHRDDIGAKGRAVYAYQLYEAGTSNCSNAGATAY